MTEIIAIKLNELNFLEKSIMPFYGIERVVQYSFESYQHNYFNVRFQTVTE